MPGLLVLVGGVFRWWAKQMRALLPAALLRDPRLADALLVAVDTTRHEPQMHLRVRRRRREVFLGSFRMDEVGQRTAMAAIRQRPRRVVLQADPSCVLERQVVLPLAAERDVARVVHYEMDRLTPFTADQVFWSANLERRDRARGRLELSLSLVPKQPLQPILAALDGMGVTLSGIEAVNRVGVPRQFDLHAPSSRRRSAMLISGGLVAALGLAALATPFVTQSLARQTAEARITALEPQIAQVEALRRRIAAGSAGNDVIAAERARNGDALRVLAATTELLPNDTVLSDLTLRQGKLSISGRSLAAPRLIPALAADPTIRNPSFVAPVTRTADGKSDTFVIRAELHP
jgi:general secretion pathway protein L